MNHHLRFFKPIPRFSACRTYYAITMCAIVAQVLAAVVVLALHWNDPCESPLNMWCTVYGVLGGKKLHIAEEPLRFAYVVHENL